MMVIIITKRRVRRQGNELSNFEKWN